MPGSVIPVSTNKVVFYYDPLGNDPAQVLLYDYKTEEWKPLPLPECVPVFWRSATKQLLCTKGDSLNYYLTDLEGEHREILGDLHPTEFFLYLPSLDAALAIRPGSYVPPERDDVWIYYFKSKQWKQIIKHAGAPQGCAVWIDR